MKNINKDDLNDVISTSKKVLRILYFLLIVAGLYIILKVVKEIGLLKNIINILKVLSPLFIGIIIAWLFNPFVKWMESKKIRRGIGTTISYIILLTCIVLLIKAIIPLLYNQIIDLVDNFPNIFSDLKDWSSNFINNLDSKTINIEKLQNSLFLKLDEFSNGLSTSLPSIILNIASNIISSIGIFIIGLVIGFFLLLGCDNLGNNLLEFIPSKFRQSTSELYTKINNSLRGYVNGALLDAAVVIAVSTIAFAIIGLKAPIIFGIFCGLMNVIPYAGPYIGGAPAVIVGFSQGTGIGIAVLIAIIIIQTIEGNVLQTLIISKTTKLNPVTIIIGLLIFGYFFGIIGMLLSTPIIGVLKVVINYFNNKYDFLNFN